jgi:P4 family phage/plasmid primase-like protien
MKTSPKNRGIGKKNGDAWRKRTERSEYMKGLIEMVVGQCERCLGLYEKDIVKTHFNGRYGVLTIYFDKDECGKCGKNKYVKYSTKTSELDRWCTNKLCDGERYTLDLGPNDEPAGITHVGHVPRGSDVKITPTVKYTEEYHNPMIEAAHIGGFSLAKVLYKLVVGDPETTGVIPTNVYDGEWWWVFESGFHRWTRDRGGMKFHLKLLSVITDSYSQLKANIDNEMVKCLIDDFIVRCNSRNMRETLVKDCCITFHDSTFLEKLDMAQHLIGMENGVFDLDRDLFRPGRPEDYITLTTGRTFDETVLSKGDDHPVMKYVLQFFADVLVHPEVINMVLSSVILSLHGASNLHKFFLWVGVGSNGKSKLSNLFRKCLGSYTVTMPVNVFTAKRIEYGKACPELTRTKNTRVVFLQEPNPNETLNMGIIKEVTGGDSMFTRGLYSSGAEIQCRWTPILMCNVLPNVTDTSHGAWRRLIAVDFPTLFTNTPTERHHKKLDLTIDSKIESWADAFMTYMLVTYKQYAGRGLVIPSSVTNTTEEYHSESDFYTEFVNEKMVKTDLYNDFVNWSDLWNTFYAWFKVAYGVQHLPKKSEARKKFQTILNGGLKFHGWLIPQPCSSMK